MKTINLHVFVSASAPEQKPPHVSVWLLVRVRFCWPLSQVLQALHWLHVQFSRVQVHILVSCVDPEHEPQEFLLVALTRVRWSVAPLTEHSLHVPQFPQVQWTGTQHVLVILVEPQLVPQVLGCCVMRRNLDETPLLQPDQEPQSVMTQSVHELLPPPQHAWPTATSTHNTPVSRSIWLCIIMVFKKTINY